MAFIKGYVPPKKSELHQVGLDSSNNLSIAAPIVFTLLQTISHGYDEQTRVGNEVRVKQLNFNVNFRVSTAVLNTGPSITRAMILWDAHPAPTGVAPAYQLILKQQLVAGNWPLMPLNNSGRSRFTVLADEVCNLGMKTDDSVAIAQVESPQSYHHKFRIPLDNIVRYDATGNAMQNIVILFATNSAANHTVADYAWEVLFTDN